MPRIIARSDIEEAELSAVIIRAEGTIEEVGVIAYYHRNPLRRLLWWLRQRLRRG